MLPWFILVWSQFQSLEDPKRKACSLHLLPVNTLSNNTLWRLSTPTQMHILHTYLHVHLTNNRWQAPHTWNVLRVGRQTYLATLEHTSYEGNLLALMHGRPEINELFVGYTHSLRLCTPRPHVCKQCYWVFKGRKHFAGVLRWDIVPSPSQFSSTCTRTWGECAHTVSHNHLLGLCLLALTIKKGDNKVWKVRLVFSEA